MAEMVKSITREQVLELLDSQMMDQDNAKRVSVQGFLPAATNICFFNSVPRRAGAAAVSCSACPACAARRLQ